MKKQTFHQSISIFTMRIWLHYNGLRGDTRHSYLNDFANGISQTNHFLGFKCLTNLIEQYRANHAFKNVLVYDNINNVPIYDEVYVPSQNAYRVRLNCKCNFSKDERGNSFYQGYETYDQHTGELIFVQADQEKVRAITKAAYEFIKKRRSMPGIVHPKANEVAMEQGMGKQASVGFNLDVLRDMTPVQLSQVADYLLKMKGVAA